MATANLSCDELSFSSTLNAYLILRVYVRIMFALLACNFHSLLASPLRQAKWGQIIELKDAVGGRSPTPFAK